MEDLMLLWKVCPSLDILYLPRVHNNHATQCMTLFQSWWDNAIMMKELFILNILLQSHINVGFTEGYLSWNCCYTLINLVLAMSCICLLKKLIALKYSRQEFLASCDWGLKKVRPIYGIQHGCWNSKGFYVKILPANYLKQEEARRFYFGGH